MDNSTLNILLPHDGVFKPDIPKWVFGVCSTYLFFLGVISLTFNSIIFYLYHRVKALRTDFNLLLMNLLFGELFMSVYGIPVDFWAAARNGWDMGTKMCDLTGFLLTMFGMAAINNLTGICLFRYYVFTSDRANFGGNSRKMAIFLIVSSWIWSFCLALPPLTGWGRFEIEANGMSCAPSWRNPEDFSYNIFLFVLGFFCPLIIIILTAFAILKKIRKHVNNIQDAGIKATSVKESKVTTMIVIMVSAFVFCWAPYAIQSLLAVVGLGDKIPLLVSVIPLQFAKSSILWNPIIYVWKNKTFQKAFMQELPVPVENYLRMKFSMEEKGTLSDTDIGRRQHPRLFGRFKTMWKQTSSTKNNSVSVAVEEA